jgi:hypothetical protein
MQNYDIKLLLVKVKWYYILMKKIRLIFTMDLPTQPTQSAQTIVTGTLFTAGTQLKI